MNPTELEERITAAANRTWQAIGGDVLRAAEADSIPRDEVVECVMEHLEDYGRDKEAVQKFEGLVYEEKVALLTKAFPFARYGL